MDKVTELVCCDGSNRLLKNENDHTTCQIPIPGELEEEQDGYLDQTATQEMPSTVRELVDTSMKEFLKVKEQAQWTLCAERPEFKIWCAPYPGQQILYWRIDIHSVYGTREGITAEMFDYRKRCSWDSTAVMKGSVLKKFLNDYMIVQWFTCPAGAGIVAPREFVEARTIVRNKDGSLYLTSPSIDDELVKAMGVSFAFSTVGSTRAKTYPGNGFALEPLQPLGDGDDADGYRFFKLTLVSCIELGGWLPPALVNILTTQALVDSTERENARLKAVSCPPVTPKA